ncbi:tRNA-dihydrouridine synthase family protein [Candidatus Woesearchaeota archaeon]|nr:tRNA-dihydrouridine synthase family protein [Candidatus Woesearchaeota archaeon]
MPIGNLKLQNPFFLAPMEAVNCASFRILCKERGAGLVYTDMIDADKFYENARQYGDAKAVKRFINPQKQEEPLAVQMGGGDINTLRYLAEIAQKIPEVKMIDLNCGCPLEYMLDKKGGCYLMKEPELLYDIVRELRKAIKIPFTIKLRSGWDDDTKNVIEVAKELEKLGIDAITVHARTRKQKYDRKSDWPLVRKVKESISIPLILSGDVTNIYLAYMAFQHTKCDFIMIGRGAKNNPSIFKALNEWYKDPKVMPNKPQFTYDKNPKTAKKDFMEWLNLYKNVEHRNVFTEIQDHALWTIVELKGNVQLKKKLMKARSEKDIVAVIKEL